MNTFNNFFSSILFVAVLLACTPAQPGDQSQQNTIETATTTNELTNEAPKTVQQETETTQAVAKIEPSTTSPEPKQTTKKTKSSDKGQQPNNIEKKAPANTAPAGTLDESNTTVEEDLPVKVIKQEAPAPKQPPFSHDAWDQLLRKYVTSTGNVNYSGFKADEAQLDAYLKSLADNPIQDGWSRGKKMAYWINAYNAFTVKLIVQNYPVSSITKLHGGKPWDHKWINLGGKTYTLNNIENDILRPVYKDARIHFAVNCAAKSCPPLLNRAWTASNLEANFEKQAKAFINSSKFNSIEANSIKVSKIFEWYAKDFGNLVDYLNKYSTTKIDANAQIGYKEYDWALNGK